MGWEGGGGGGGDALKGVQSFEDIVLSCHGNSLISHQSTTTVYSLSCAVRKFRSRTRGEGVAISYEGECFFPDPPLIFLINQQRLRIAVCGCLWKDFK